MSRREGFCGVDVGTQGVRCVITDGDGVRVGSGERPLFSTRSDGGRHEQHPGAWVEALSAAVRAATDEAGGEVKVASVALDATSGTVLVEAADGTATGPALMYDDARAASQADRARVAGAKLWADLGYRLQTTWALPKVLWLVEEADLRESDRVVHQADHLARFLVGHPVSADTSHALKTGADLRDATWPADIFADLGLATSRLPDLVFPGSLLGRVSPDAAAATGLPAGAAVRAGMTDGCAGQIAAGAMHPGSWSSTLGTTLVIKGSVRDLLHDPSGAVYCHRHPDGGWLPGGASSSGAGVFKVAFPHADLAGLTEQAALREPVAALCYPLSGTGERFPFVSDAATGFVDAELDEVDRFISLSQGLGYVERLAYDVLASLGANVSGPVALTGGATRNPWLNQLRTDIIGRLTTLPAQADAAFGMAVLAASPPGGLADTAQRMVTVEARLTPDPDRAAALDDGYHRLVEHLADRGWLDPTLAATVQHQAGAVR